MGKPGQITVVLVCLMRGVIQLGISPKKSQDKIYPDNRWVKQTKKKKVPVVCSINSQQEHTPVWVALMCSCRPKVVCKLTRTNKRRRDKNPEKKVLNNLISTISYRMIKTF